MDELILVAGVALPLLAVGAIVWLSVRRFGPRLSPRSAAGILVFAGVCALVLGGGLIATDGLSWRSILNVVIGLGLIALYLPRMRKPAEL